MMKKHIIIEKDLGVFITPLQGHAVFAKNNIIGATVVSSFETAEAAKDFIETYLAHNTREFDIVEVETYTPYPSVINIIKAGYGKYTHTMIDFLETPSGKAH
jgi:hypothetical protein